MTSSKNIHTVGLGLGSSSTTVSDTLYARPTTHSYGFTSLPADMSKTPPATNAPKTVDVSLLKTPESPLAKRIDAYARVKLPQSTYDHSLRVYSYGLAIARECFPGWGLEAGNLLEETWFLTAMLHDIGTPEETLKSTRLSYEFFAGLHAFNVLRDETLTEPGTRPCETGDERKAVADQEQAESVAEAIIRHQDVQDKGNVTVMTRLIHLGTLLDNVGANKELISKGTIDSVIHKYSREGWLSCFRTTVEQEKREKPYAMVSRIEGFEEMISGNMLR